jgi:predicted NAD/FAD-binding protein
VDVDTGFMVYNAVNYPHLCSFFETINLGGENTSMGFSVSMQDGNFEWCSDSLSGLLATPSNIINPRFYLMMSEIFRFNKEALAVLRLPDDHATKSKTVGEFLKERKFSDSFRDNYLVPMTAAIWSATSKDMMGFPIITLFTFLNK